MEKKEQIVDMETSQKSFSGLSGIILAIINLIVIIFIIITDKTDGINVYLSILAGGLTILVDLLLSALWMCFDREKKPIPVEIIRTLILLVLNLPIIVIFTKIIIESFSH